uniref:Uncharacterized protein n=1 Tax=Meloidogyne javanica TaxID=6303 RepID=A0A915MB15_MELJA
MQRSVLTSKLLKERIEECVPKRIENKDLINFDENENKEIKKLIINEENNGEILKEKTKEIQFPWLEAKQINIQQLLLSKLGDGPKILE